MTAKTIQLQEYSRLVKLQKLSSALLYAKSSEEVGSIIINEGFDALGSNCGDISIINPTTQTLQHVAHKGYPNKLVDDFFRVVDKTPTLTTEVLDTKKPIFIEDFASMDKRYAFAHSFIELTNSSAAVLVPLIVRGAAFGCLQFTFQHKQRFTPSNKEFILYLADQCAQALDRIIALENAQQAKDELAAILKGIDDAIIVRNVQGEITYVNPAALHMHGYKRVEEMLYMSLEKYFAQFSKVMDGKGKSIDLNNVPFLETTQRKKRMRKVFYKVLKKNNVGRWLEITSLPVLNAEGSIDHVVSVMHDITEEKQNEYSKDEFFGIASHELKTPVTTLKAYAQVLEKRFRKEGDTPSAEALHKMDVQVDKLTNLIRDLLDVTKIEGGRLQFHKELFEFNALVDEVAEEVQLTTDQHTIVCQKASDAIIFGDRDRVGQVITNLLTNAVKYSPKQDKIIVKVQRKNKNVVFSVQDFGIGIAEKDQKHVFERFYREKNLQGDTFPGLGLGLYIASEIVKRQNGKIWVESKKGKGSTFSFSLPLAEPLSSGVTLEKTL